MAKLRNFLTTAEASQQLGVPVASILRYYHSGILRGERVGRGFIKIDQNAVLSLMKVIAYARAGAKPIPPHLRNGNKVADQRDQAGENGSTDDAVELDQSTVA